MSTFLGKFKDIKEQIYKEMEPQYNMPSTNILLECAINKCFTYLEQELEKKNGEIAYLNAMIDDTYLWEE